ncbi:MAG: hypothetical protein AAFP81_12105 [Pseudomonadota bacterium]
MKPLKLSLFFFGAAALPAFAHDHPTPHTHDLPIWGLALIGLAAGAFGTWATMKCLDHMKEKS